MIDDRHFSGRTFKAFRNGTHRATSPEATLDRTNPWFNEIGITRIGNVTGLDAIGLPVVMVCRPNSRSVAVSQGKGLTLAAAKASGLMEAIELWHAETAIPPLQFACEVDLRREHAIVDTSALPKASASYLPTVPILWTNGFDAVTGANIKVPFECVHMNSCVPLAPASGFFLATSNGLASGNCLIEAVIHGVCEVIERDSAALWHPLSGTEIAARRLDLESVDDTGCLTAIEMCWRAGAAVAAWDMTSDIGVPAFASLIVDRSDNGDQRSAGVGYGCHPNRGVALFRAISEAAQSRLTFISGSRDDVFRGEYEDDVRARLSLAQFRAMIGLPGRSFKDAPTHDAAFFEDDLSWLVERLAGGGISSVLVVELTKPWIGIPVVRVIVPGLEGPDSDEEYRPGARRLAALAAS